NFVCRHVECYLFSVSPTRANAPSEPAAQAPVPALPAPSTQSTSSTTAQLVPRSDFRVRPPSLVPRKLFHVLARPFRSTPLVRPALPHHATPLPPAPTSEVKHGLCPRRTFRVHDPHNIVTCASNESCTRTAKTFQAAAPTVDAS